MLHSQQNKMINMNQTNITFLVYNIVQKFGVSKINANKWFLKTTENLTNLKLLNCSVLYTIYQINYFKKKIFILTTPPTSI